MSIQDKITRLQTAKEGIADAITAAGGTVAEGDGFEEFSSDIGTISSGISVDEDYTISEGTLTAASVELDGDVVAHIPDGVTTLGNEAFKYNSYITKVIIPNSVTTIEDGTTTGPPKGCFFGCHKLKTVILSETLTKIGNFSFYNCDNLSAIIIPNSVTYIGGNAFANCYRLSSITIPDSVTNIGNYAFSGCSALTDIYYTGTQAEWEQITIGTNAIPSGATIHYEYVPN